MQPLIGGVGWLVETDFLKINKRMTSRREKDIIAKQQLREILESRGVDVSSLGSQVSNWGSG